MKHIIKQSLIGALYLFTMVMGMSVAIIALYMLAGR